MSVLRSNCYCKAVIYNVCSSFPAAIRSYNCDSVLPKDGTLVPKHDEDTSLMNVQLEILILNLYYIDAQFCVTFHVQETNSHSPSQAQRILNSLLRFNIRVLCSSLSVTRQFNRLRKMPDLLPAFSWCNKRCTLKKSRNGKL